MSNLITAKIIPHNQACTGSVLHILLLAIVLFAAISAVVTSSGKGGTDIVGPEKAKIYAGEIIGYANQLSHAVRDVMLKNDCTDTQISFEKPPFDGSDTDYVNSRSPSDYSCHVYHPNGGGVAYVPLKEKYLAFTTILFWYPSSQGCIEGVGSHTTCNASEKELTVRAYGLKKEICEAINMQLLGTKDIQSVGFGGGAFDGVYNNGIDIIPAYGRSFCVLDTDGTTINHYTFVHTLIAR